MRVALQKYNLEVQCKKGTLMHIAHAYCTCIESGISEDHWWNADEVVWDSFTWDSWSWRAYSNRTTETRCFPWSNCSRWWYSGTYPCYQARVARQEKSPPAVQPCYDKWNKLIKSQGLVFRGKQLVLPLPLRRTCKLSSTVVTLALEDVFAVLVKFFTGQEWVLK